MERKTFFVEVLLPLPVSGSFTYRIPFDLNDWIAVGQRVVVQFGPRKVYAALVVEVHERVPSNYRSKYVLDIIDENPIVLPLQLKFWDWMAHYYLASQGEVMNAALPAAFKLSSESRLIIHPDFEADSTTLSEKEAAILMAVQSQEAITISDAAQISGLAKVLPLINTLKEKGVILLEEELRDRYKAKKESWIRLNDAYLSEEMQKELFEQLEKRAYKQLEVLMAFFHLTMNDGEGEKVVRKKDILSQLKGGDAALRGLQKKGIFTVFEQQKSRLKTFKSQKSVDTIELSSIQQSALDSISEILGSKNSCLLHGITGSGKTEIYIKLMAETFSKGKQVLYLLPEIALTAQIVNRLRKYFGASVGVYHSRYTTHEKVEIWNRVLAEQAGESAYQIILSARSGIFLPFKNLGLVIVDEEHDTSYKQFDPAPRYHARDAALMLAQMHGAKVLMGSATPSIESYYNAKQGKYGLVHLEERYGEAHLPLIQIGNLKTETWRKTMNGHFSSFLMKHIKAALERKEQVILFQNRRGFAPRLECEVCNWVPDCPQCDISLVYHKQQNRLRCHLCGYSSHLLHNCSNCGSHEVRMKGFGTEKLEEDIGLILPKARIRRMDLDSTRAKNAYERLFEEFSNKSIDILIGTQMVVKGLDFENVSVVGVMNADNMINFPDFRSFERSFQMLVQVAGRAGRKDKKGTVIIQSFNPHHSVIQYVIENNYPKMYESQILERRNYHYPPFYRLIKFTLKHKDYRVLNDTSYDFAKLLRNSFGKRVLGPTYPMIGKIRGYYLKDIQLKIERGLSSYEVRERIKKLIDIFQSSKQYKNVRVVIDVDPV
jgi:primosomal protein N' (replication factor Y)